MAKAAVAGTLFLTSLVGVAAIGALGVKPPNAQGGSFDPAADVGLDPEQLKQAARALRVADRLHAQPLPVLAMVVAALGESGFRAIPNGGGSGFCGVFQAHPNNIACGDTERQARHFLLGGKGFQAGGAIRLSRTVSDPGVIATRVEASGKPGSFYGRFRPQAERIIRAWRQGGFEATPFPAATANDVLSNTRIHLTPGQRADLASGGIDPRVLASLSWLAERHDIQICALRKDHSPGSNHEAGRAADICVVDTWICRGGTNDPCADLVRELAAVKGPMRSTELIYCWDPDPDDPNMFAKADHCDHTHVGWDG